MPIAFLNIGSNLGDRQKFIDQALEKLSKKFGYCCISREIETDSWGYNSGNRFLNIGVSIKTEETPESLLRILKDIESEISVMSHRNSEGRYADRELDIDIMAIDGIMCRTPNLSIPHKHLKQREFFLQPLSELAPDWVHPETGEPVSCLLKIIRK